MHSIGLGSSTEMPTPAPTPPAPYHMQHRSNSIVPGFRPIKSIDSNSIVHTHRSTAAQGTPDPLKKLPSARFAALNALIPGANPRRRIKLDKLSRRDAMQHLILQRFLQPGSLNGRANGGVDENSSLKASSRRFISVSKRSVADVEPALRSKFIKLPSLNTQVNSGEGTHRRNATTIM